MVSKLRSVGFIKETTTIIRKLHIETDFSQEDEFGDAKKLQESWQTTPTLHPLIEFLCKLFKVNEVSTLSSIINGNRLTDIDLEEDEENNETEDDEYDEEFSGTEIALLCSFKILVHILIAMCKRKRKRPLII